MGEIIIHEIEGTEFVEITNVSNKFIHIYEVKTDNRSPVNGIILSPGQKRVFNKDKELEGRVINNKLNKED